MSSTNSGKILLVEKLWDSITESHDVIPTPEWHKKLINKRYKEHLDAPDKNNHTMDEVRKKVSEKLSQLRN